MYFYILLRYEIIDKRCEIAELLGYRARIVESERRANYVGINYWKMRRIYKSQKFDYTKMVNITKTQIWIFFLTIAYVIGFTKHAVPVFKLRSTLSVNVK